MKKRIAAILMLFVMFVSCGRLTVYDDYRHIEKESWHKDSAIIFVVEMKDTLSLHLIQIGIRNNMAYPYCNLFLFVRAYAPSGAFVCDTLEYMLTDERGSWLGRRYSKLVDNRLEYRNYVQFPTSGKYTFEIRQGMRHDLLPNIVDVGLHIERLEEKNNTF